MIIGFLGKGGSGKSTLSTLFAQHLVRQGMNVLAIDADHNMDLSYNLGAPEQMRFIGQALPDILAYAGVAEYRDIFSHSHPPRFSMNPLDPILATYSVALSPGMRVMATGPHTENILYDKSCSHALVTPLKVILPFLDVQPHEAVVIDEKAGTDSVGTGVTTGFTFAVVVSEPTRHGMKAARQIADMLTFYKTPYLFVLNKVARDEDVDLFEHEMGQRPHLAVHFHEQVARLEDTHDANRSAVWDAICAHARAVPDQRVERTKEKYTRNISYQHAHA